MYEMVQLNKVPIIWMGDLNYDRKVHDSLSKNSIYYIDMAYPLTQLIVQLTRETNETCFIIWCPSLVSIKAVG